MRKPTAAANRITQTAHLKSRAVDISARPDRNIYAPEDMVITESRVAGQCGNMLRGKGKTGTHTFCHLERDSVRVDQRVKEGQIIGVMGYTGYTIPSGPAGRHLHWYIKTSRGYVYPPSLITKESRDMITAKGLDAVFRAYLGRKPDAGAKKHYTGKYSVDFVVDDVKQSGERATYVKRLAAVKTAQAKKDALIKQLRGQIDSLSARPKKAELQQAIANVDSLTVELSEAKAELAESEQHEPPVQVDTPTTWKKVIDFVGEQLQIVVNKLRKGE